MVLGLRICQNSKYAEYGRHPYMKKSCIGIKTLFFRSPLLWYNESVWGVTLVALLHEIDGDETCSSSIHCVWAPQQYFYLNLPHCIVLYNQYAGSHHNHIHNSLIKKKKKALQVWNFESFFFFSCSKNDFCAICNHAWIGYRFLDKAFVYWAEFPNPTTTHWPQRFLWPDQTWPMPTHTHTQASCISQALITHMLVTLTPNVWEYYCWT